MGKMSLREATMGKIMILSKQEQSILISTYTTVMLHANTITEQFYQNLFEALPEVEPLFTKDMRQQRKMFTEIVRLSISSVDRLNRIEKQLRHLGEKHTAVGIKPEYYPVLRDAWLQAMADDMGDAFTADVRQAWSNLFDIISSMMLGER